MSFDGRLINRIDIIRTTLDKWGEPTETVETNVKCRVMYGNRVVRNFKGEEVLSTAKIFFLPSLSIDPSAILSFDGLRHGILRIGRPQDSRSVHHIEVYVD